MFWAYILSVGLQVARVGMVLKIHSVYVLVLYSSKTKSQCLYKMKIQLDDYSPEDWTK